jgi:hypothetical protein
VPLQEPVRNWDERVDKKFGTCLHLPSGKHTIKLWKIPIANG